MFAWMFCKFISLAKETNLVLIGTDLIGKYNYSHDSLTTRYKALSIKGYLPYHDIFQMHWDCKILRNCSLSREATRLIRYFYHYIRGGLIKGRLLYFSLLYNCIEGWIWLSWNVAMVCQKKMDQKGIQSRSYLEWC